MFKRLKAIAVLFAPLFILTRYARQEHNNVLQRSVLLSVEENQAHDEQHINVLKLVCVQNPMIQGVYICVDMC